MSEHLVLDGIPDFHDTVEFLRHHHQLSRESIATQAGISTSYLNHLIQSRTTPGPTVFDKLLHSLGLESAQQRHVRELWQPPVDLPSSAELAGRLAHLGVHDHLDYLDSHEIMGAYFDPLLTVLHANRIYLRLVPGLAESDNNVLLWMLTHTARDTIEDWDDELRFTVTILRASLGRYRQLPRARNLFRTLRTHPEFRRAWDQTPLQVTYSRIRPTPARVLLPDTDEAVSLSIEIDEYGACPGVLIAHGLYQTSAIACLDHKHTPPR